MRQEFSPEATGEFEPLSPSRPHSATHLMLKRAMDLLIGIPLFVLLVPLFVLVALAIKLDTPGPVFFRQQRRGRGFAPFNMLKFRSMACNATDPSERYETVESDPRITRVGHWLRVSSLDELPQLFNVLAGPMSLVGPRPLVEWESRDALARWPRRFEVKPGITGWSQVTVRNSVDFAARLDKDVEYVEQWNPWFDLRILFRTPAVVFWREGIYPDS